MKIFIASAVLAAAFSAAPAFAVEPIPGSLTYDGQPHTKLSASPVGSPVNHTFRDDFGRSFEEVYIITENRDLKLVDRRAVDQN